MAKRKANTDFDLKALIDAMRTYINELEVDNTWTSAITTVNLDYEITRTALHELLVPLEKDIESILSIADGLVKMKNKEMITHTEIIQASKIHKVGVDKFLEPLED